MKSRWRRKSKRRVGEWSVTYVKQRNDWRMSCDVGKAHSPIFPPLHLRHSSFSNPSVALPTSQIILQSFRCFTYVTAHSPIVPLLHVRHSSFSNPSFAFPTPQALHLRHLASRPWTPYSFLVLRPAALPPGKVPGTHFIGGWVDPKTTLDMACTHLTSRIEAGSFSP